MDSLALDLNKWDDVSVMVSKVLDSIVVFIGGRHSTVASIVGVIVVLIGFCLVLWNRFNDGFEWGNGRKSGEPQARTEPQRTSPPAHKILQPAILSLVLSGIALVVMMWLLGPPH
jgi:ABC-type branched-subunit amino acid transport system permease subunit